MKELSIEQKAKRYDEALERAKELLEVGQKDTRDKRVVLSFFPELVESEDDGICKKLIAFLKQCKAVYGDGFKQFGLDIDDALAWLEKQGEQKLLNKCMYSNDNYTDEERKVLCDGCEEDCKLKQKPVERSEEDENRLNHIIQFLEDKDRWKDTERAFPIEEDVRWIKSLRPQKQWKPSEDQMVALKCAITTVDEKWVCMNTKDLESLYEDLKKLKE